MKNYVCPDCGKTFEEGNVPASCPNCGCPSSVFQEKYIGSPQSIDFSSTEKVYYSDDIAKITNKIWSFGGYNIYDNSLKGVTHYPVTSISNVSISHSGLWLGLLLLGIALLIFGIWLAAAFNDAPTLVFFLLASIIVFLIAYRLRRKRVLHVMPHNSLASYTLTVNSPEEALKYLNPMLQCLIENR